MLETAAPLAEIAPDRGLADPNHLTRIFRRFSGMNPHRRRSMAPA